MKRTNLTSLLRYWLRAGRIKRLYGKARAKIKR
jgi:hypothetical protein